MGSGWMNRVRCWFREFSFGIKNLVRWFPIVWDDRDWDWAYMAYFIEAKALSMAKTFRDTGISTDRYEVAEDLENLAAKLRYLIEDGDSSLDPATNEESLRATEHAIGQLIGTRLRYWWD